MADGIFAKVKNFFFEDEIEDMIEDEQEEPVRYHNPPEKEEYVPEHRKPKAVSMNSQNNVSQLPHTKTKLILFKPVNYEDAQAIIDNIRAKKPVIIDMTNLETDTMFRVLDFVAGSVYALDATIKKIAFGIFVVAPNNMSLVYSEEDE